MLSWTSRRRLPSRLRRSSTVNRREAESSTTAKHGVMSLFASSANGLGGLGRAGEVVGLAVTNSVGGDCEVMAMTDSTAAAKRSAGGSAGSTMGISLAVNAWPASASVCRNWVIAADRCRAQLAFASCDFIRSASSECAGGEGEG